MASRPRGHKTLGGFRVGETVVLTTPYKIQLPREGSTEGENLIEVGEDSEAIITKLISSPTLGSCAVIQTEAGPSITVSLDMIEKV